MPRKPTDDPRCRWTCSMAGISSRHGMHVDAQKLITRGRPRRSASDTWARGSRRLATENAGARRPASRLNPTPAPAPARAVRCAVAGGWDPKTTDAAITTTRAAATVTTVTATHRLAWRRRGGTSPRGGGTSSRGALGSEAVRSGPPADGGIFFTSSRALQAGASCPGTDSAAPEQTIRRAVADRPSAQGVAHWPRTGHRAGRRPGHRPPGTHGATARTGHLVDDRAGCHLFETHCATGCRGRKVHGVARSERIARQPARPMLFATTVGFSSQPLTAATTFSIHIHVKRSS